MLYNYSYNKSKFVGYGFVSGKINMDITINTNPIITTHPKSDLRSQCIDFEVYI